MSKTQTRLRKRLNEIETLLSDEKKREHVFGFLEEYIKCETICREMIFEYKKTTKSQEKREEIKIRVDTAKKAWGAAGYQDMSSILNYLFSSSEKRWEKSAKKLRDAIVHAQKKEDINEVDKRYKELTEYMDEYLSLIRRDV